MIAIPAMKADLSADINHLGIYLRKQNSYPEQRLKSDVQKFEQFRRDALAVTEASENGQQSLLRYVALLKSIIPRLARIQGELKISVAWSDAFTTSKKITSSALSLDLVSCLWNLASFESILGGCVDRGTVEGFREANKHFQQAAGYFQFISDNVLPTLGSIPSPCLSHDSLLLCKQLMLAEAQLCFYGKAVKDCVKSVVVAKLAAQAAIFYSSSATTFQSGTLSFILDISWFAVSTFQANYFRGAAEYWQALASKESALQCGSGYGEEVVRYNRAEFYVRQALETRKKYNLPAILVGRAEALLQAITTKRCSAQRDLQTVYMEGLPAESTLTDVQPITMAKPTSLPEFSTLLSDQDQIFRYVLPRAVIESNKNFYDEVNTHYQRASLDAEKATNKGNTKLNSLGLPDSLYAVKADQPSPDTPWLDIHEVVDMSGNDLLTSFLADLKAVKQQAWMKISEVVTGNQTASSGTVDLNMNETEVVDKPKPSAEAVRLEERLHALGELFKSRAHLLEQMKSITQVNLSGYVLKTLENGGDIYAQHVKFANESKTLKAQIEEGINRQEALLKDIAQLNKAFLRSREKASAALARNKLIQGMEQYYNVGNAGYIALLLLGIVIYYVIIAVLVVLRFLFVSFYALAVFLCCLIFPVSKTVKTE
eukprot:gene9105-10051_t